jgi:hypothetical protein
MARKHLRVSHTWSKFHLNTKLLNQKVSKQKELQKNNRNVCIIHIFGLANEAETAGVFILDRAAGLFNIALMSTIDIYNWHILINQQWQSIASTLTT